MNKTLKFAPDLIPLVLSGEKTSTWRLFDDKNLQEGEMIDFLSKKTLQKFAVAKIISVKEKPLGKLTEEDKKTHEKFASDQEMYATYKSYYKKTVTANTPVKLISFELRNIFGIMNTMKPIVTFDDFAKLDLRVGKVINAEEKEGSDKLLRLTVDFGELGERTIFSGIRKWYTPEDLKNKQFVFIVNLAPRKMMDEVSEGMLLAAGENDPKPLTPSGELPNGSPIL